MVSYRFEQLKKTIDCAHNFQDNTLTNDTFMSNLGYNTNI
jgi:hypothetical protein